MRSLRDVPVGETVKVVKIDGDGAVRRRIMDMGITKGTELYVRKVAPLGDPVELTVRICAIVSCVQLYIDIFNSSCRSMLAMPAATGSETCPVVTIRGGTCCCIQRDLP